MITFAQNLDSEIPLSVAYSNLYDSSIPPELRVIYAKLLTKRIPHSYQEQIYQLRQIELEAIRKRKSFVLQFASEFTPTAEALIPQLQSLHPEEFI